MVEKDTLYARWLNNDLTAEEVRQLRENGEWEELQQIIDASDDLYIPALEMDSAWSKLKSKRPAPARRPVINRRLWLPAAACLVLLLGAFFWLGAGVTKVQTPPQARLTYELPDKSLCQLNAGSTIKFRAKQWDQKRSLRLDGEAFFEVQQGASFIVETKGGQVEVLGTSFNVRAREGRLYVSCFTGAVEITTSQGSEELQPGEEVRVIGDRMVLAKRDPGDQPSWISGRSTFRDEPIDHVFREIERYFDFRIKGSSDLTFTGSFDHSDIELALRQVCIPLGLRYDTDPTHKIVTIHQ